MAHFCASARSVRSAAASPPVDCKVESPGVGHNPNKQNKHNNNQLVPYDSSPTTRADANLRKQNGKRDGLEAAARAPQQRTSGTMGAVNNTRNSALVSVPLRDDRVEQALAVVQAQFPHLLKYFKRALLTSPNLNHALREAQRRYEESNEGHMAVLRSAGAMGQRQRDTFGGDGFRINHGNDFITAPTASRIVSLGSAAGWLSETKTIMQNPRYHDYYLENMGHELPIPYPAVDNMANKTLGVRGSVAEAFMVPAGYKAVLLPTPDSPVNSPFTIYMQEGDNDGTVTYGKWYGGISPQALMGPPPNKDFNKSADDRSLQFKAGIAEISVAVAYNQSAVIGHLDPYTTLSYGKALGLTQVSALGNPTELQHGAYSGSYREFPYFAEQRTLLFNNLMQDAVRQTLVGSSAQSGVTYRQIIRPHGHCFAASVDSMPQGANLPRLGFPAGLTGPAASPLTVLPGALAMYAQGMYLIDNSAGSAAVAVDLTMQLVYRVRVDNQAPAVYMAADDDSVRPHSIEFKPTTVVAPTRSAAAEALMKANNQRALVPAIKTTIANTSHERDAMTAYQSRSGNSTLRNIGDVVGRVPVFGGDARKILGGVDKITTAGDVGDVFEGVLGIAEGAVDGFSKIFNFLG